APTAAPSTPKNGPSTTARTTPTSAAVTARWIQRGSSRHDSGVTPKRDSTAQSGALDTFGRFQTGMTSAAFRGPLAEKALGAEDEDQDQDREDDRLRPVAPRRMPGQRVVERLHETDDQCAEHGAGEVPDPAEHGGGEGGQPELEPLV